ncbi:MAG: methyltransferase domain-containing protein [Burkholderiales bacterium]
MTDPQRIRDPDLPITFAAPHRALADELATARAHSALARWQAATLAEAERHAAALAGEFPDQAAPDGFWHAQSNQAFRDFFVWGHDHDFGHGVTRRGAMGPRHVEIIAEALAHAMLPGDLAGKDVLDVGCWTGGDLLALAGMGARVTAIEEHPAAAAAARRLLALVGLDAPIFSDSVYRDRRDWAGRFDLVYCSGVVYHVTDPVLFLRILFAYLKPGGSVFLETKAAPGDAGLCTYSGTMEKGWNWYAPDATALGRWLVDAGFDASGVRVLRRGNGRLLASATRGPLSPLRETAGFSRPGSWLEGAV